VVQLALSDQLLTKTGSRESWLEVQNVAHTLVRECPSAMKAALGIFLTIMAGGGANAGPDGKEVPRVAFLGFEFRDG
jgi:hypothetical protein